MEDWKKGDIAICINNSDNFSNGTGDLPPLRLNTEYIVKDIFLCRCGELSLDVGLASKKDSIGTRCGCRELLPYPDTHWCHVKRFVKKRTKEELNSELEAALKDENYELAREIGEKIKL